MRTTIGSAFVTATIISSVLVSDVLAQTADGGPRREATALEEIVVLARRREEPISKVPTSLTAISGADLEANGFENVTAFFGNVPSVYFSQGNFAPTSDFTYLVIRGAGAAPALDPSVGVFVDGSYQTSIGYDLEFLEVERIEILRGPQSTLFGRNTLAGALNIVTRDPSPGDAFYTRLVGEVSGYDTLGDGYKVRGYASGGLSGNVAGDFVFSYARNDGYVRNVTLDSDQIQGDRYGLRTKLIWTPSDTVSVKWSADYSKVDGGELGYGVQVGFDPAIRAAENAAAGNNLSGAGLTSANDPSLTVTDNLVSESDREIVGTSLTIDVDLRGVNFISQTSYRKTEASVFWDADSTDSTQLFVGPLFPNDPPRTTDSYDSRDTKQDHLGQELRIQSDNESRIRWMLGAYFFDETFDIDRRGAFPILGAGNPPTIFDGTAPPGSDPNDPTNTFDGVFIDQGKDGWSLFGQVSYDLTDRAELTVGVRYAEENVDYVADVDFLVPFGPGFDFPFIVDIDESAKFDDVLPTVSLSYEVNDAVNLFAVWSRGFKSGGFQKFPADNIADAVPFDSETSENYEIGAKINTDKASLSAAAYRMTLEDQQVNVTVIIGGATVGGVRNAAEGRVTGFELEGSLLASDWLTLSANVAYNDTEYVDYIDAQGDSRPDSIREDFPYVPELTFSFQADFYRSLTTDLALNGYLRYRYVDDYYTGDGGAFSPFEDIGSHSVTDFRVGVSKARWTAELFVNNLFDEEANTQRFASFANQDHRFETPIPPRQIGLRYIAEFGR